MSQAVRTTLIIGVFWILLSSVGLYWVYGNLDGKVTAARLQNKEIEEKMEKIHAEIVEFEKTESALKKLKSDWKNRKKIIPAQESTTFTYAYFNKIAEMCDSYLVYNFDHTGSGAHNQYYYSLYEIKGESTFKAFYRFIHALENLELFYEIHTLDVSAAEIETEFTDEPFHGLSFRLVVKAYYGGPGEYEQEGKLEPVNFPETGHPFYPLVKDKLPCNVRGLVNVEKSRLMALTSKWAYIEDQNGKLVKLTEGNEVYLGKLTGLDLEKNACLFTLNKGGFLEKIKLFLEKSSG